MSYPERISPEEFLQKTQRYGCHLKASFDAGFDLWVLGWGEAITMAREDDGRYSKWSVDEAFRRILRTKPDDWLPLGAE